MTRIKNSNQMYIIICNSLVDFNKYGKTEYFLFI